MAKCPRPGEKCQEYSCGANDEELCKADMGKVGRRMTREELIKAIYKDLGLCPDPHCDFLEEDCLECGEKQLAEYEARIRAEERAKTIDEFVESISESVLWDILAEVMKRNIGASEGADKAFDYLREIGEKLKEQKNEINKK